MAEFTRWLVLFFFLSINIVLSSSWNNVIHLYLKIPKNFIIIFYSFDSVHRGKMEQILQAYGLAKETVAAITILYRNREYFDIVAGVLQGDTLAP